MAMQKVSSGFSDGEKIKFETPGNSVEGYLVERCKVPFDERDANKYIVKTDKGMVNFLGSKKIDDGLLNLELGVRIRVTYTKKERIQGGKTLKLFDIEFDPSDRISVDGSAE